MNSVNLIGRVTKEPELRYIPGTGTPVSTFDLAIDRDYKNKDGKVETDFIHIEIMGKSAEFCANYLDKGRLIAVKDGAIRTNNYSDQDGNNKTFTKVVSRKVQALDFKKKKNEDPEEISYQAIEDDDIPF